MTKDNSITLNEMLVLAERVPEWEPTLEPSGYYNSLVREILGKEIPADVRRLREDENIHWESINYTDDDLRYIDLTVRVWNEGSPRECYQIECNTAYVNGSNTTLGRYAGKSKKVRQLLRKIHERYAERTKPGYWLKETRRKLEDSRNKLIAKNEVRRLRQLIRS